ncbi:hypothetical protein LINGRAHAP2_LOCUS21888 [Linum grandiflorum]
MAASNFLMPCDRNAHQGNLSMKNPDDASKSSSQGGGLGLVEEKPLMGKTKNQKKKEKKKASKARKKQLAGLEDGAERPTTTTTCSSSLRKTIKNRKKKAKRKTNKLASKALLAGLDEDGGMHECDHDHSKCLEARAMKKKLARFNPLHCSSSLESPEMKYSYVMWCMDMHREEEVGKIGNR